ncbi:hypothetical protein NX059_008966 [Plenodomus lindquistii]|nr:hypothetical protein NX059_008966 [Plenodomus lindquistii]
MASFGKVLDLLDDRYLELQDVVGNVEPLPTLVPYEEYKQTALVYSMDTNLDIYTALMQEFTERRAHELRKELWTWCVQWEVEAVPSKQTVTSPPSRKKRRLDVQQTQSSPNTKEEKRKTPLLNIVERCIIDPTLMQQEDMLRCLIDIVQVDSTLVPNFIEFLYRWVDFYEGDGKALKAAMKWEIPSLWEFEYHPLVLPTGPKQAEQAVCAGTRKSSGSESNGDLNAGSKLREKPDLAALEEEVELSERLQYREVHYGIKAPQLRQPLPRLINIPRDPRRRVKYYAACFKSRQRAFNLLIEAGLTVQQISNYKKQQAEPARETPCDGEGKGLRHYEKDARAAQAHFAKMEMEKAVRAKNMEVVISNRLAFEAGLAARSNPINTGSTGVPLIPATPSYTPRPALEVDMLERLRVGRGHGEDRINIVPQPLVGRLKSKLFEGAYDMDLYNRIAMTGDDLPSRCDPDRGSLDHREISSSNDDSDEEETELPSESWGQLSSTPSSSPLSLASPPSSSPAPPLPQLSSLSTFTGPPAANFPSAPAPSILQDSNRPLTAAAAGGHHMQIPTNSGATLKSAADGEPWTPRQIGDLMNAFTPTESHRVTQMMGPSYTTFAADKIPPSMDPRAVAVSSIASASTVVPSGSHPVQTSWVAVPAQTQPPLATSVPQPSLGPTLSQAPTGQSPIQPSSGFGDQVTTLSMRPPMPTSYSDLTPGTSQPPVQRRVSSDPAGLNYLLTLGSGGSIQRNNVSGPVGSQHQQHTLASRPSLPELPRLPSQSALPPLPYFSVHPPTPRLPPPSHGLPTQPFGLATSPITLPWNDPQPPIQTLTNPFNPSPPRNRMTRPSQPPPLSVPSMSLPNLTPSLRSAQLPVSGFLPNTTSMSVLIYLPKCLRPGNALGPDGMALGDAGVRETDAVLLGSSVPGSGQIVLSRAIFLPMGIWQNVKRRTQTGSWKSLESYSAGLFITGAKIPGACADAHRAVYSKLCHIYSIMSTSRNREQELTKRWRTSKGPMTHINRGSVWEGWGVTIDRGIDMSAREREGALAHSAMIDEGVAVKSVDGETAMRKREIEELLAAAEDGDFSDGDAMEM